MSKKRGLSLEEKREKMLQIFYDSQDFYLLKELEKLGPKKGVISQSVKDVIQSLVDDDLVLKDKVGSSIYFWSLPSTAGNQIRSVRQKLESESQNCKKRFSELQGQCNVLKKGRENSDEREEALSKLKSLEKKYNELKDEIKQYADNDPAAFEAMKESINAAYSAANRWTDNIFTLRQWCSNNFPQAKEQLENLYTEAGITEDFDYLELPHLGSLGKASNQIVEVNKAWPSSPSRPFSSSMHSSFRIVVVGDIHEDWELEHDYKALKCLEPELVLFTGDFGNENVELVRSIEKVNLPKAAILGNHDSWSTSKFSNKVKDGVQQQLESLGEAHVGYGRLDFPTLKLSVVGGRPFSCGGDQLFRKKLLKKRYGVKTMEESAHKIHMAAMGTPQDHSIIFLSHNGPTGLGSSADDICGKDWEGGGDHGDPDLAQAISLVQETSNYSIPLVVFGHMHKEMLQGGFRKMISIASNNTTYLNGAIVPRVKPLDSGGSIRAFTVLHLSGGRVTKAVETWVSVVADNTSIKEEHLLLSEGSSLVESV